MKLEKIKLKRSAHILTLNLILVLALALGGCAAPAAEPEPEPDQGALAEPAAVPEIWQGGAETTLALALPPAEAGELTIAKELTLGQGTKEVVIATREAGYYLELWTLNASQGRIYPESFVYSLHRTSENYALKVRYDEGELPRYKLRIHGPKAFGEYYFDGSTAVEPLVMEAADPFSYKEATYIFTYSVKEIKEVYGLPSAEEEFTLTGAKEGTGVKLTYPMGVFECDDEKRIFHCLVRDDLLPHPRGIAIGAELDQVLALFPQSGDGTETADPSRIGVTFSLLYGEVVDGSDYGVVEYENGQPARVKYVDQGITMTLTVTEGKISAIDYRKP